MDVVGLRSTSSAETLPAAVLLSRLELLPVAPVDGTRLPRADLLLLLLLLYPRLAALSRLLLERERRVDVVKRFVI
jgi:hypothetical protein